jgi:hypothetical protein
MSEINEYEGKLHSMIDRIFDKMTSIAKKAIDASMAPEEGEYNRLAGQSRDFEERMWKKYPNAMRAAAKRQGVPVPPEYDKPTKKKK